MLQDVCYIFSSFIFVSLYLMLAYELHKLATHLLGIQFCLSFVVQMHTTPDTFVTFSCVGY